MILDGAFERRARGLIVRLRFTSQRFNRIFNSFPIICHVFVPYRVIFLRIVTSGNCRVLLFVPFLGFAHFFSWCFRHAAVITMTSLDA